jgi:hypothetical protein
MGLDAPTIYRRKFLIDTIVQLAAPGAPANDDNPSKLRQASLIAGQKSVRVQLSQNPRKNITRSAQGLFHAILHAILIVRDLGNKSAGLAVSVNPENPRLDISEAVARMRFGDTAAAKAPECLFRSYAQPSAS